ncbi:MAG: hypothetical protein LBN23_01950 [Paludibacter sp.]|jgi:hypothetical protein|nr:hypothetical protein [Paludibacter sp.]
MKKFLIKISFVLVPLLALCVAYPLYFVPEFTGNLGRLAQIPFGTEYDAMLEKSYPPEYLVPDTLIVEDEKIRLAETPDVITIGDSYSGMAEIGYQNYLALRGVKVVNFVRKHAQENPVMIVSAMLNDAMLDSTVCRTVIVQTGDRNCISRLQETFDDVHYQQIKLYQGAGKKRPLNLQNLCSFIRLTCGYDSPVSKYELTETCFSHKWGNFAYCYNEDLWFQYSAPQQVETAKTNLKVLNDRFLQKGIKLIFLICADKYDVYRPLFTDNSLPVDTLTDDFENIPEVCVINTKAMFQEMVKRGEKDVYFENDSHASHIANRATAERILAVIARCETIP